MSKITINRNILFLFIKYYFKTKKQKNKSGLGVFGGRLFLKKRHPKKTKTPAKKAGAWNKCLLTIISNS